MLLLHIHFSSITNPTSGKNLTLSFDVIDDPGEIDFLVLYTLSSFNF